MNSDGSCLNRGGVVSGSSSLTAAQRAYHGRRALLNTARAAPAVWAAVCRRQSRAALRHVEFRLSVARILEREGYCTRQAAPASYYNEKGTVRGRVDLVALYEGVEVLAIELDLRASPESGWKLLTKRKQGLEVLLLAGFAATREQARVKVDGWFQKPTEPWLAIEVLARHELPGLPGLPGR